MPTCSRAVPRVAAAMLLLPGVGLGQDHDPDQIVVTGVLRDIAVGDIGQPITVLRDEVLERARRANLGETLAGQLGVSSSYFGAGASRPIIRGLGGPRVRALEDGIDSLDAASVSDDHAVSIDPLVAEQVEIFRGPTTLLYGSGAVGGVVNTITRRIPEGSADAALGGAFELRGDTVASERSAALRLDGGGESFAWHFDGFGRDAADYELPSGRLADGDPRAGVLENSAVESDGGALGASWLGTRGFIGVAVSTFDSSYGVPGVHSAASDAEIESEPELARVDLEQKRVDLKGGWDGLAGVIEAVNLRVGVADYEHRELHGGEVGTVFANDAYEARVELLHQPFGAWSGAVGVQLGERQFAALGDEAFVPPVDSTTRGVFAVEELALADWRLSFGARVERQRHRPANDAAEIEHRAKSVSFAAVRRFGARYSLALNTARAERLPAPEELFANGPHHATRTVQLGRAGLTEETSSHVDVSLRKTAESGVDWTVTAFATHYDDFIFLMDTGGLDTKQGLPIHAFVQHDAKFDGLEAEVFVPIGAVRIGEMDLRLFGDYVRGTLADGANLPRMPPLRYGARLEYHDERLTVGLELTRYADQDHVAPFEEPTDGFTMVDADVVWRLGRRGGADLEIFASGSNLADRLARRHASLLKDVAPLPGRNYAIGVRARF